MKRLLTGSVVDIDISVHFAHPLSTDCSGYTVPRETGVARGAALVTLWCQILAGLSHGPGVCWVDGRH